MGRMEKLDIELPAELSDAVEEAVASGEYASASDVVLGALKEWKATRLIHGYTVEEMRALVDEAEASGDLIDGEEAFRRIKEEFEKNFQGRL
jgi:antitoxin ParD1/3/4